MKTIVISTPDAPERAQNVLTQFASQQFTDTVSYMRMFAVMNKEQPPVGIMQSFKEAIKMAMDAFAPAVAIFEDDLKFTGPHSLQKFHDLYEKSSVGQLGLFLGGFYQGEPHELTTEIARVDGNVSGLHAIIIHQKWYKDVLEAEEPYNLDYWLSQVRKVPIYSAYPMLVLQQDGFYSFNANKVTNYTKDLHLKYKIDGK